MFVEKLNYFREEYRFEAFLISVLFILFGSLIIPEAFFETYVYPLVLLLNVLAGINLITNKRNKLFGVLVILFLLFVLIGSFFDTLPFNPNVLYGKFLFYFMAYLIFTYQIIRQILKTKEVGKNLILGVISGYVCLGLVGVFVFLSVELENHDSFNGLTLLNDKGQANTDTENLLYYSYITLLTIGYGDITPATTTARKATILMGLLGQFYNVIITAVVVGKFTSRKKIKNL